MKNGILYWFLSLLLIYLLRPALIISPNQYNKYQDVIIAFVTSKLNTRHRMGDYKIREWEKSNLPKPSMIRMKFATIDKSMIIKTLGRLVKNDSREFSLI